MFRVHKIQYLQGFPAELRLLNIRFNPNLHRDGKTFLRFSI